VLIYKFAKWSAPLILAIHVVSKIFFLHPNMLLDLIVYNLIVIIAILSLFLAPLHSDSLAIAFAALACAFWISGSIISSLNQFYPNNFNSSLLANAAYSLFYPFAFLAIPRIAGRRTKLAALELLDAAIFALGISSITTALILVKFIPKNTGGNYTSFFAVLYPVCDLVLIVITIVSTFIFGFSRRIALLNLGIFIFAASDFYYLWRKISDNYQFGGLSDDAWLIGIVLISLSLWSPSSQKISESKIHPAVVAVSIFISPALLSAIALRPDFFPIYVVIPTITTLGLAFLRMALVIRQASKLGEEKVLARTDELTGLANRRRLIAELDAFSGVEGALLLLDLDGFKPVNDQYGHETGDQILRQVASRFIRSLPNGAVLARLGGDEFGVVVPGDPATTLEVANALRATLSYPFLINGNQISLSVSIGHARNDHTGDLLQRADTAMYEAKRTGVSIVEAAVYRP